VPLPTRENSWAFWDGNVPDKRAAPLQERRLFWAVGDEELEGAGDDLELDGEAVERLAVDLGADGVLVERLAKDGIGLEEMDASEAAEPAEPKGRQVAQVAEAALRGEYENFKLIVEEVGACGDFEWAAVVFGAAHDDERAVDLLAVDADAKTGKFVAEDLARALPPIRENAKAGFEAEIERVDDHAVGTGAGDAEKIFFVLGLLERSGETESDVLHFTVDELLGGLRNVPGEVELLGENIGGAAGEEGERDAVAVLVGGEAVDDFVEGAVAAAGDDEAAVFFCGARCDFRGVARAGGFGEVGVDAARSKNVARLIEHAAPAATAVAGVGVVDQQCVLEVSGHPCSVGFGSGSV